MKNGDYDIHLDFKMAYFMKNLLAKWLEMADQGPFSYTKYKELLKQFDAALNLPKDVDELFQEKIKSEQFRREYLSQFLDDNNPEDYLTKKKNTKPGVKGYNIKYMSIDELKEI